MTKNVLMLFIFLKDLFVVKIESLRYNGFFLIIL